MVSIQVAGHVCVDLTPQLRSREVIVPGELTEVGPIEVRMGGTISNCARAIGQLGAEVFLSGMVGDDDLGLISRRHLEDAHPGHVELIVHPTAATSYSVVVCVPGEDRSFWHHTGANDEYCGEGALQPHSILHFGYPTLCPAMCADSGRPIVDLFERAHAQEGATSLDLAYLARNSPLRAIDWDLLFARVLPHADVFCPSWDDIASCLPGIDPVFDRARIEERARAFIAQGAAMVLITAGKHGAHLATSDAHALGRLARLTGIDAEEWAGQSIWDPAILVERQTDQPLDSNGAGDTFKAAFLVALTRRARPRQAIRFASEVVGKKLLRRPLATELPEA